jgi:glycosyltransferase involved in cell wall biosynthesis
VVAPAYREDYGLTVLEAFARGRPVIVCEDGGGLVELVEGTGAGLVVEPTAEAIGRAVADLRADQSRAHALAEAASAHRGPDPTEAVRTLVEAIGDAAG